MDDTKNTMNSDAYIYDTAHQGDLARVQELVKSSSDVNYLNSIRLLKSCHSTPLGTAATKGHLLVVQFLVECGADMGSSDDQGRTPLNHAARRGHLKVVQYLIEYGANMESSDKESRIPLNSAGNWNRVDIVRFLIDYGANVNLSDNQGWTPLNSAANWGHIDAV